jgi:hypothetical protein
MTKEEIIDMAREAGFSNPELVNVFERFAVLVASAEREACAKVADGWPDYDVQGLAEAIRARGDEA